MTKLGDDIFADYEAVMGGLKKPSWLRVVRAYYTAPGFRAALLYRFGRRALLKGWRVLAFLLERKIHRTGADIAVHADIGSGVRMPHPIGIVIGARTRIGCRASILQNVTFGGSGGKARPDGTTQPHVGDDVTVGAGAKILGPVDVGSRSVIGANAVVTSNVPDDAVAVGVPARVIKIKGQAMPPADDDLRGRLAELERRLAAVEGLLARLNAANQGC